MTREEIQAEIDRRFELQRPYIESVQAQYFATHGRYFQGLSTHSVMPADGAEIAPDRGLERPSDQAEGWLDVGQLPAQMLSQMEINVYEAPAGHGFEVVLQFQFDGQAVRRSINFGPEETRNKDWHQLAEEAWP